jgi:hypothetical protein
MGIVGSLPGGERFEAFTPPLRIRVTGSLFHNGDYQLGTVPPTGHKPQTAWGIHPVSNLQTL